MDAHIITLTGAITTSLLLLVLPSQTKAQEMESRVPRYEINLTVGVPGALVSSKEFPNSTGRYDHDLYYFYEPYYSIGMSPEMSLDANVNIREWLKVGGKLGYYTAWGNLIDPKTQKTIGNKEFSDFSLAGQVRFTFYKKPPFSVYAGVAAGATYRHGTDQGNSISKLLTAYEILPLGYQISYKSVYGIIECAFGSMVLGGRIGIGCRF